MDFASQFNQLLGIEPVQHISADDLLKEIDAWEWERLAEIFASKWRGLTPVIADRMSSTVGVAT